MTKNGLLAYAEENGIEVSSKMTKSAIIEKIEGTL